MEKFALQSLPQASLNRSMQGLFQDLIDITMESNPKGCLKPVPTNYGYVFFWYGYLNKKNLQKNYYSYVSREKTKDIKKTKKQPTSTSLQDQLGDFLFSMVRDNPKLIGAGHAETHLAILSPNLKQANITDAAKQFRSLAQKLEKIEKFSRKYLKKNTGRIVEEIETNFRTIDYVTEKDIVKFKDEYFWDDECGYIELAHRKLACEIQVRVHFEGEDTLGQVVDRIDKVIEPIKSDVDLMFRFGKSMWPF
jgi:hypothetical protein